MLATIKITPAMLSSCSINTQSFVYYKSSSISQFISGESRNIHPEILLRYLSGTVTSAFKAGTAACGGHVGWFPSGFCGGFGGRFGLSGVFPTIFVLNLNDLPSETL